MKSWALFFLEDLFNTFNENELNVVLMRSYDWLNDDPIGDIDLLIAPCDQLAIRDALDNYTKNNNWLKVFEDKDANHIHFIYFKEEKKQVRFVHIDLQTFLGRKGFFYCSSEQVMENPDYTESIPILNESNSIASLLLHVILDKSFVKEQYRELITGFDSFELAKSVENKVGKNLTGAILQWKERGLPDSEVATIEKQLRRYLLFKYPKNIFVPLLHKIYRTSRYFMRNRGILIAALGPDGAGKSTVLEHVQNTLSAGDIQVAIVYMGKRDTLLPTSKLIRMYYNYKDRNAKTKVATPGKSSDSLTRKNHNSIFRSINAILKEVLGLSNWFTEQWLRYLIQIRPILQQGGVVLCDRYAYDLAERPGDSIVFRQSFLKLLKKIYPKPAITYFLWEEPEILYKRVMENTVEENIILIKNYRTLLVNMPNYKEIRTNSDASAIGLCASKDILLSMHRISD